MRMMTGESGKVLVSYQLAISIRDWVLTRPLDQIGPPVNRLVATINTVNRYWVNQQPLTLGLWMGATWWVWTDVELEDVDIDKTVYMAVRGNPVARNEF